jgi:hypothetical protein
LDLLQSGQVRLPCVEGVVQQEDFRVVLERVDAGSHIDVHGQDVHVEFASADVVIHAWLEWDVEL